MDDWDENESLELANYRLPRDLKDSHVDYWHKLSEEEKEFMRQFNKEYHGQFSHTGKKNKMLTTEEDIKHVNRQRNNRNRDAFVVSRSKNRLVECRDNLNTDTDLENDWAEYYKKHGYKKTVEFIDKKFDKDLENRYIDSGVTESRRFIAQKKLKTIHKRRGEKK